uniref:VENN motif pre-toxin domain-containing protein n=2 Tax=Snodgrassella TaxID=1193515 RepID=UPI001EF5C099
ALNAVTSAVTGILGGQTNLQAATNALAPYAAELIGKQFGHGDNQNQAAQLVAHALLGAISASVNGGNAAAGAVGASAAELAAQYLIKQLPKDQYPEAIDPKTGEIDPNRLPESVKANIRDLSSAVATVSGGLTGGSLVNAQIAGVVGQNAVENNELDLIQLISPASAAMLSKDAKHREAMKIAHQIRMASSAITIVQVGGGYAIAGVGLVAPEAIGAVYSACRVNPAGCTVVTVESADILAGVATGAVTVSNLPASAIKSTSKIGGKYAEEISKNATKNINPILKLGETKVINEVSVTRVGRWMSPEELRQMQSTGKIVQGGGGQTFISINGVNDFKGAAPKGSVYVEFDVPTNSLIQGGKNGWYKMLGPDANASQKHLLNKRGGALLPDVNNIKIIDKK